MRRETSEDLVIELLARPLHRVVAQELKIAVVLAVLGFWGSGETGYFFGFFSLALSYFGLTWLRGSFSGVSNTSNASFSLFSIFFVIFRFWLSYVFLGFFGMISINLGVL